MSRTKNVSAGLEGKTEGAGNRGGKDKELQRQ